MKKFFVDKHARVNGRHDIHTQDCIWIPDKEDRIELGIASTCSWIMAKARTVFPEVNGCIRCCKPCHDPDFVIKPVEDPADKPEENPSDNPSDNQSNNPTDNQSNNPLDKPSDNPANNPETP